MTLGLMRSRTSIHIARKHLGTALMIGLCVCLPACQKDCPSNDDKMPDVVGKPEAEAKKTLEALGLTVEATKKRTGATAGTVVDQSPHANQKIPNDAKVTLIVEEQPPTGNAGVPRV